jgi:hypothetical protein
LISFGDAGWGRRSSAQAFATLRAIIVACQAFNKRLALFQMFQSSVENFFDAMQLGAPHFFHVREPAIHHRIHFVEPGVHLRAQIAKPAIYIAQPGMLIKIPTITAIVGTLIESASRRDVSVIFIGSRLLDRAQRHERPMRSVPDDTVVPEREWLSHFLCHNPPGAGIYRCSRL